MKTRNRGGANPGRIHIIGGSLHGSRLGVPALPGLRPTPQRLRQTLFDWLTPAIGGALVLDVFAGTGALGIEALSRGARAAVFLERDRAQADSIAADLARLHQTRGEIRCVDALRTLAEPAPAAFDVAFVDPPFDASAWTQACALLDRHGWLARPAWVYVETGTRDAWHAPTSWSVHRQRDAASVRGTLFRVGAT